MTCVPATTASHGRDDSCSLEARVNRLKLAIARWTAIACLERRQAHLNAVCNALRQKIGGSMPILTQTLQSKKPKRACARRPTHAFARTVECSQAAARGGARPRHGLNRRRCGLRESASRPFRPRDNDHRLPPCRAVRLAPRIEHHASAPAHHRPPRTRAHPRCRSG